MNHCRIRLVIDTKVSQALCLSISGKAFLITTRSSQATELEHLKKKFNIFPVQGVYSLIVTAIDQGPCKDLS